jgi:hypothetical protein
VPELWQQQNSQTRAELEKENALPKMKQIKRLHVLKLFDGPRYSFVPKNVLEDDSLDNV